MLPLRNCDRFVDNSIAEEEYVNTMVYQFVHVETSIFPQLYIYRYICKLGPACYLTKLHQIFHRSFSVGIII